MSQEWGGFMGIGNYNKKEKRQINQLIKNNIRRRLYANNLNELIRSLYKFDSSWKRTFFDSIRLFSFNSRSP